MGQGEQAPRCTAGLILAVGLVACTSKFDAEQHKACARGIEAGYVALQKTENLDLGGTVQWTKAASLLSAAKVQLEFERYPNCLDKVARARAYLKSAGDEYRRSSPPFLP